MAITDCPIRIPIPLDFEPPRLARQIMQEDAQLGRMFFSVDSSDSAKVRDGPMSSQPVKVNIVKSLQSGSEESGEETDMTATTFPSMLPKKVFGKWDAASPMTEDTVSELSSVGSGLHYAGRCRPCQWVWSESGCVHGAQCSYCHFRHASSKVRPCKGRRASYRKLIRNIAASRGQTFIDNTRPVRIEPVWGAVPPPDDDHAEHVVATCFSTTRSPTWPWL
mmetsp:Transcript_111900/g.281624  ORF Transcript_111900/g.281624 Transcript_111900/m.281624 type:complete len:221 (+) Transcript_111900:83-745(+)